MAATILRAALVAAAGLGACFDASDPPVVRLAVTTSTRASGLTDVLLPVLEDELGCRIDLLAVGSGKALAIAAAGDADLVVVHDPDAERAFQEAGHAARREPLMFNHFHVLGPPGDPAGIRGLAPPEAFRRIAAAGERFVSRSDDSGTHRRELALWEAAGGLEPWEGYVPTGQGMGPTLVMADQMRAYVLSDSGTWLRAGARTELVELVTEGEGLRNDYAVLTVDPGKGEWIQGELADRITDFLVGPRGQALIDEYRIDGSRAFHPAAGVSAAR